MYVCIHVCVYTCMCVYMYVCIHVHGRMQGASTGSNDPPPQNEVAFFKMRSPVLTI